MALHHTLPDWVYVFVDPGKAVNAIQATGQFASPVLAAMSNPAFAAEYTDGRADFHPLVPNTSVSTGLMSSFSSRLISFYRVEYDAELARRTFFREAPSRLTGIYAFESMAACEAVSRQWRWPLHQVQRFKPLNVLRATRVNMEIVTLARLAYSRSTVEVLTLHDLWCAYLVRGQDRRGLAQRPRWDGATRGDR